MLNDLYKLRKDADLTQQALANLANLAKTTVLQIENSDSIPRLDTVCQLAHALDMLPGDLFNILIDGEDFAMKGDR